jgi:hypothetical protein
MRVYILHHVVMKLTSRQLPTRAVLMTVTHDEARFADSYEQAIQEADPCLLELQ